MALGARSSCEPLQIAITEVACRKGVVERYGFEHGGWVERPEEREPDIPRGTRK